MMSEIRMTENTARLLKVWSALARPKCTNPDTQIMAAACSLFFQHKEGMRFYLAPRRDKIVLEYSPIRALAALLNPAQPRVYTTEYYLTDSAKGSLQEVKRLVEPLGYTATEPHIFGAVVPLILDLNLSLKNGQKLYSHSTRYGGKPSLARVAYIT